MTPIFPWMGGKRRLAPFLLPLFPDHRCYVEPFAGAAALYFMKPESEVEVINDINGEIVNLYRVLKHHLEEFVRQYKWALTSREMYRWEQMAVPATLTDIQRAARWFYLQKLSFGGKVDGQTFGTATTSRPRLSFMRIEEDLTAAHIRLAITWIENLPWHEVVERYDRPHTLVYCDPPYWDTAGYGVVFPLAEYDRMAELARTMQGTMIISVNDHPEMRRAFSGLPMRTVDIDYTVGGGAGTAAQELVIGNWRQGWPEPRPLTRQIDLGWH